MKQPYDVGGVGGVTPHTPHPHFPTSPLPHFPRKLMSKLVLIRHGQSLWNAANKFTGWVDVPLSERGRAEAMIAACKLKEAVRNV